MEQIKNIIVDGIEYPLENFSDKIKSLVLLRQEWANDLQKERTAAAKTDAAIRSLDVELKQLIGEELNS